MTALGIGRKDRDLRCGELVSSDLLLPEDRNVSRLNIFIVPIALERRIDVFFFQKSADILRKHFILTKDEHRKATLHILRYILEKQVGLLLIGHRLLCSEMEDTARALSRDSLCDRICMQGYVSIEKQLELNGGLCIIGIFWRDRSSLQKLLYHLILMPLEALDTFGQCIRSLYQNTRALLEIIKQTASFGVNKRYIFIYEFKASALAVKSVNRGDLTRHLGAGIGIFTRFERCRNCVSYLRYHVCVSKYLTSGRQLYALNALRHSLRVDRKKSHSVYLVAEKLDSDRQIRFDALTVRIHVKSARSVNVDDPSARRKLPCSVDHINTCISRKSQPFCKLTR